MKTSIESLGSLKARVWELIEMNKGVGEFREVGEMDKGVGELREVSEMKAG